MTSGLDADSFRTVFCDVSNVDRVKEAVATAVQDFGGVDVLCNIAGSGLPTPCWTCRTNSWSGSSKSISLARFSS